MSDELTRERFEQALTRVCADEWLATPERDGILAHDAAQRATIARLEAQLCEYANPFSPAAQAVVERWLIAVANEDVPNSDCLGILKRYIDEAVRSATLGLQATVATLMEERDAALARVADLMEVLRYYTQTMVGARVIDL